MPEERAEGITTLPEVTPLEDARPERPADAVGIGEFWYEPAIWEAPVSPAARVLYAGLCSFVPNGKINRRDLRNTLEGTPDPEIQATLDELVQESLLQSAQLRRGHAFYGGYVVNPVSS
ncbi:hypothetical protein [Rubrobacter aplysinae]|uniref:hypothetical protein n=1 Tax=Rubrobacter aplysinae TaxID=909625 RepID=UPI00064BDA47|nr:hypothetical protein [Rubrobacter aplysinae]